MSDELTEVFTDAGYNKLGEKPIYLSHVIVTDGEPIENVRRIEKIPVSSTQAEYHALIWAMVYCKRVNIHNIIVKSDNQTMVRQIQGSYRVHNPELKKMYTEVKFLKEEFDSFKIVHIKRKFNIADKLIVKFKQKEKSK